MPRSRSEFETAAGKLISAIQKEWNKELGGVFADISESVMGEAHYLLQSRTIENARILLGSRTVKQYLGELWVKRHPDVLPEIDQLETILGIRCPRHCRRA
jgi:hypothetical protein